MPEPGRDAEIHAADDLYGQIAACAAAGEPWVLVTVLRADGSTPVEAGARMLVDPAGRTHGTVGGGAAEAEALRRAVEAMKSQRAGVFDYSLGHAYAGEGEEVLPICGGRMRILVDPAAARHADAFAAAAEARRTRQRGALVTRITNGTGVDVTYFASAPSSASHQRHSREGGNLPLTSTRSNKTSTPHCLDNASSSPPLKGDSGGCWARESHSSSQPADSAVLSPPSQPVDPAVLSPPLKGDLGGCSRLESLLSASLFKDENNPDAHRNTIRDSIASGVPACLEIAGVSKEILLEPIIPAPHLIIVGGGHVGQALARQADWAGFAVTVIDDREAFCAPERFPAGVKTLHGTLKTHLPALGIDADTYIALITRGYMTDAAELRQIIHTPAAYIGMIGSRRKVALVRDALLKEGAATQADLDRVHAPIGIPIGAETVAEIAVSITAELIAVRRKATKTAPKPARAAP